MLQSEVRDARLQALGKAMLGALESGITREELMITLIDTVGEHEARQEPLPGLLPYDEDEPVYKDITNYVYDECPDGLIDLRTAAIELGIAASLLNTWISRGHIKSYGRLKEPAKGDGFHLLKMSEILDYQNFRPRQGGRPRKTAATA